MSGYPPLVEALLRPEAYPERPASVELVETHISWLFLTGQHVYKVKKAVDYGFLDFTTLEKRHLFCHQEVELNRRLSPQVYLGVVEVRQQDGGFAIEGPGQTVEYAVQMRQLPRERAMDVLLRRGLLTTEHVRRIARKVADFHARAETSAEISRLGGPETVRQNVEENFQQTEKYVGTVVSWETFDDIVAYSRAFLDVKGDVMRRRAEAGRVRDCHGDLHTAQVFLENGIHIIDCIEFNQRFRYSDVGLDIAFLSMDLDYHGREDLAQAFVDAYEEASGDGGVRELLDFFKAYRAYVRAKVTSFRLDDSSLVSEAREQVAKTAAAYYRLAHRYARQAIPQPALFMVGGLMGTGKSHAAAQLAQRWDMALVLSDAVRKELAGIVLTEHRYEPFGQGIYAPEFTARTYDAMLQQALDHLSRGQSVVLDASFAQAERRRAIVRAAQETGADVWFIQCTAPHAEVRRRLTRRLRRGTSVSDGRWELYGRQKAEWEPVAEVPPGRHLLLDTSGPHQETIRTLLRGLFEKAVGTVGGPSLIRRGWNPLRSNPQGEALKGDKVPLQEKERASHTLPKEL